MGQPLSFIPPIEVTPARLTATNIPMPDTENKPVIVKPPEVKETAPKLLARLLKEHKPSIHIPPIEMRRIVDPDGQVGGVIVEHPNTYIVKYTS